MTGHIPLQQSFHFGQRIDISLVIPVAEVFPLTMSMFVDKCMFFMFFPSRHRDQIFFIPSFLLVYNPNHSPLYCFCTLNGILSPLEQSSIRETESRSVYFLSWVINERWGTPHPSAVSLLPSSHTIHWSLTFIVLLIIFTSPNISKFIFIVAFGRTPQQVLQAPLHV